MRIVHHITATLTMATALRLVTPLIVKAMIGVPVFLTVNDVQSLSKFSVLFKMLKGFVNTRPMMPEHIKSLGKLFVNRYKFLTVENQCCRPNSTFQLLHL